VEGAGERIGDQLILGFQKNFVIPSAARNLLVLTNQIPMAEAIRNDKGWFLLLA
jgi:hypothetical protein